MNILITGAAGYIGSQLLLDVPSKSGPDAHSVIIYDNMQDERYQSLMNLPLTGRYSFHYGDVQDADELTRAAESADVIIHLAALTNAVVSFQRTEQTELVNYHGTENVVAAALNAPRVRRVIYASTCSVYGETHGQVNEASPCHPESPYGRYKLAGERAVMELGELSKGRVFGTGLRLGTVFGVSPGLRVHTVVNLFALHGALSMPIKVFGSGEQLRPFVHVRDASSAFLFALHHEETAGQVYNVVGENVSVNQVLDYVRPRFPRLRVERMPGKHLNQLSYEVDGSKLRALGWSACWTVEQGVDEFARLCTPFSSVGQALLSGV
ncbi:MAG: NAD(P)-dependent oxidoreductase [Chloroflexota bacterium]|nr:NAD(P)-dependent oxidoreductase [Chloroflexota bacterium]